MGVWLRYLSVLALIVVRLAPVEAVQDGREALKVFVLAGQSNMEGPAVADLKGPDYNEGRGTLEALLNDPEKGNMVRHLQAANGKWSVHDDVWCRYKREREPLLVGPLTVGFSVHGEHHFGPELQFGHVLDDFYQQKQLVLLIKTAWGGKSLYKDFRPPSSGGAVGPYYTKMIADVREALANLATEIPNYPGRYELAGFVWYQGWNDGVDRDPARIGPCLSRSVFGVRRTADRRGLSSVQEKRPRRRGAAAQRRARQALRVGRRPGVFCRDERIVFRSERFFSFQSSRTQGV